MFIFEFRKPNAMALEVVGSCSMPADVNFAMSHVEFPKSTTMRRMQGRFFHCTTKGLELN